jgi:uncharacterized repeat protein (TIGR03803 family)
LNLSDNTLYGATSEGGTANAGVLFKYTLPAAQASTLKSYAQEDNKEALAEIKTPMDAAFDVNLYPNPNNGIFNINVAGKSSLYRVKIISTLGQLVYEKETVPCLLNINLNNVAKGMYLISISPVKADSQYREIKKNIIIN